MGWPPSRPAPEGREGAILPLRKVNFVVASNMPPRGAAGLALALALLAAGPLAGCAAAGPSRLRFRSDLDAALSEARAAGKPALLDFRADWCSACEDLDRHTLSDPKVRAEAARFVAIRVDCTEPDVSRAVEQRFGIVGLPTVVFVDGRGEVLRSPRALGFVDADELVALLRQVR